MKKTFTSIAMLACISFFASCSKDVKAPEKNSRSTNSTNTSSTTQPSGQTQQYNQGSNGCGGDHNSSYNNSSGSNH